MSDWTRCALEEVCDIYDGPHATPTKRESGPYFLSISSLQDGRLDLSQSAFLCEEDYALWTKRVTPMQGDIVFSYETRLGQAAMIPSGLRCCLGRRMGLLRTKDTNIADPAFLLQYYLGAPFQRIIKDNTVFGTTVDRIPLQKMGNFEVLLPPLHEQKKIAEILSGVDRQILSIKCAILQARKIRTAITKELIGSIRDELVPLSEATINHDSRRMPIKSEERALRRGPYRYFGASGVIDTIDDFLFDGCYILVGEDGANIIDRNKPLAFKVSGRFWVNNHAHVIQPRESCDVNFLTYYLESLDYTGIASGSAQPKITRAALDAIQVPLPPLEVQKKIGAAIESTVQVAISAEKKEERLVNLKRALSADLLSGRKRVTL